MSQDFTLDRFSTYLTKNIQGIAGVRQEVEEIEIGFHSTYVEWKAEHEATLERLAETMANQLEEVGPELQSRVQERPVEEERIIAC